MRGLRKLLVWILIIVVAGGVGLSFYDGEITIPAIATVKAGTDKVASEVKRQIYVHGDGYTMIDTAPLFQRPELPTGCESVALTMALQSLGFDLDKTEIADNYLVYDDTNYAAGFVGDPHSENGGGILPPGLTNTANTYLQSHALVDEQGNESYYNAYNISGTAFTDLFAYVDAKQPVLIWITYNYQDPVFTGDSVYYDGVEYPWYRKEHCVLLGGYNLENQTVLLYDPLKGLHKATMNEVESLYNQVGYYAVAVY